MIKSMSISNQQITIKKNQLFQITAVRRYIKTKNNSLEKNLHVKLINRFVCHDFQKIKKNVFVNQ